MANMFTIIGFLLGLITLVIAYREHKKNALVKRAEFYTSIVETLFKDTAFIRIRERLDQDRFTEKYYADLKKDLEDESTGVNAEMTNYLNFLEYVLVLKKINVIRDEDIIDLLKYYLENLAKNKVAIEYIKKYKFKNLAYKLKLTDIKP